MDRLTLIGLTACFMLIAMGVSLNWNKLTNQYKPHDRIVIEAQNGIKAGDRIAQIRVERVWDTEFVEVKELSETERGTGGIGSTGQ